jgi:type I restriction enzyme, S subunit
MNNQIEITFGKIGRAITGKTPSSNDPEDFGEGFPFVTPTDSLDSKYVLHTARQLSNEGLRKLKSKALPPNSVLVSCIGSAMGKVVMNSTTCITNQQFNSIIVDTNRFCPHYIYYALRNSYKLLRNAASGSTALPMLNKTDFEKLQIRVFKDKAQQRKIAAVLSTLDAKIALNHRINGELEGLAKLLYDYWFVQYDFPLSAAQAAALGKPKLAGQPYRTSGGKMLFNPTLNREIPEGWEVKPVEAILAKENPSKKIPASEILENGNVPVIDQSKEFICGFTNDEDARIRDNPKIIFGDHTRILKFINFDFARGADGTQMIASNSLSMPPHLFYHSLLKIDLSSYGYARHFKFLKQSNITLPDSNLAQRFEVIVAAHYELIRENTFQNQELTALRDWLLPMLMNGQVRVTG